MMDNFNQHVASSNPPDENERRFLEDLEKAKALSLETLALEKFKQEKLKGGAAASPVPQQQQQQESGSPIYARVELKRINESSRSPSAESTSSSTSPQISIKPRPRPGGISTSGGLVPPPIPPKRTPCSTPDASDLINLKSPVRSKPADLDEDAFLQELDQVCSNLNLSNTRSSRQGVMFSITHTAQNHSSGTNNSFQRPSYSATPVRTGLSSAAFGESLLNQNLIDLAVDPNHPRYSILCAFDPLLSSSSPAGVTLRHQSIKESIQHVASSSTLFETEPSSQDCSDDPFDYFLGVSQRITTSVDPASDSSAVSSSTSTARTNKQFRETIYEVLTKEQSPVKTPSSSSATDGTGKRRSIVLPALTPNSGNKENSLSVAVNRVSAGADDLELATFVRLVREVRSSFQHDDSYTNAGFVVNSESANPF